MVGPATVRRGQVLSVNLDPTRGREIRKTRPCVVVSPDDLNDHLRTFIVAPLTTEGHPYPFRIACRFRARRGFVVLDQLRTVDQERVARTLGSLSAPTMGRVLGVLQEMFAVGRNRADTPWKLSASGFSRSTCLR